MSVTHIAHWVYIIAKRENGRPVSPVKVGVSSSPLSRIATIQTSCPFPVVGVHAFKLRHRAVAEDAERTFHRYQADFRLHGEWFDIDPLTAVHLLRSQIRAQFEASGVSAEIVKVAMVESHAEDQAIAVIRQLRFKAKP